MNTNDATYTNEEVKLYLPWKEVSFGADPNWDGATDEEHDRADPDQNRGSVAEVIKLFWSELFWFVLMEEHILDTNAGKQMS